MNAQTYRCTLSVRPAEPSPGPKGVIAAGPDAHDPSAVPPEQRSRYGNGSPRIADHIAKKHAEHRRQKGPGRPGRCYSVHSCASCHQWKRRRRAVTRWVAGASGGNTLATVDGAGARAQAHDERRCRRASPYGGACRGRRDAGSCRAGDSPELASAPAAQLFDCRGHRCPRHRRGGCLGTSRARREGFRADSADGHERTKPHRDPEDAES
jgi:hypothetical protein